jgi:uncharacterized membrane protein
MNTLIVGRFHQLSDADTTSHELWRAGFLKREMCLMYVNPHGQHAIHPAGGDEDESPGTHEAGSGAMLGAAGGVGAGTLIGVTTLPALGPVGPLLGAAVGAYAGALVGALKNMDAPDDPGQPETEILPREPGILLAVAVETPAQRASAIGILGQFAEAVEEVDGTLRNGDWVDFDPLLPGKPIP